MSEDTEGLKAVIEREYGGTATVIGEAGLQYRDRYALLAGLPQLDQVIARA